MVRLNPQVLKTRAEHNEKDLTSLEEISLNSLSIQRIECIDVHCRKLQILHLTDNAISKIENLKMLKELRYLNMAMNNVSLIENLSDNELLSKADFTLNFIGRLSESCDNLKGNLRLKDFYLVGNPCASFQGYREYVVGSLHQLESLDGKQILRDERITAKQKLLKLRKDIEAQEKVYLETREKERIINEEVISRNLKYYKDESIPLLERREQYYKSKCVHSPEYRLEQCQLKEYFDLEDEKIKNPEDFPAQKPQRRLVNDKGDRLNVNEIKWNFKYKDQDPQFIEIDIEIPKYIDTNSMDLDIEPGYIKLVYNKKISIFEYPNYVILIVSIRFAIMSPGRNTNIKIKGREIHCNGESCHHDATSQVLFPCLCS